MDWTRLQGRILAVLVLALAAALVVPRLSAFGIWDPWELSTADLAQQVATGEARVPDDRPAAGTVLVASGFRAFGIREWSGRLPMAIVAVFAVAIAYFIGARFAGRRAGVWAALITATSPLFLFNARQMLGAAPAFASSAAVFLCAHSAVFRPMGLRGRHVRGRRGRTALISWTIFWFVLLYLSIRLAVFSSGVLLGVVPPLLGVAVAMVARSEITLRPVERRRAITAAIVLALALVATALAAHAIWADYDGYSVWTGGVPRGGTPPSWEVAIERVFHSFAPWSALLPLALARMLVTRPSPAIDEPRSWRLGTAASSVVIRNAEEGSLRLAIVGWVVFGFAAQTLYTARYGPTTFVPLIGAALAVALAVRDVERDPSPAWASAVVTFLFAGLIIRDFGLYASGPIGGLPIEGIEVPEDFNKSSAHLELILPAAILRRVGNVAAIPVGAVWPIVIGLFALLMALGLAANPSANAYPRLRAELNAVAAHARARALGKALYHALRVGLPIDLLKEAWKSGPAFAIWISVLGLVVAAATVFGALTFIVPNVLVGDMGLTTLGLKIGRALVFLPVLLIVAVALLRLLFLGFSRLRSHRLVPGFVAAILVAAYASHAFLPVLSSQFSPREVYDAYNELAHRGEPLGEFRVGSRAAAYYAEGDVEALNTQEDVIAFLSRPGRVWAAFRADDLAGINREYRRRHHEHLFVVDARSSRMILATNRAIRGRDNRNYLADAVIDTPPHPEHPLRTNFDNRVELLGIDLDLPHGSYVGPGEAFRIVWYFRVNAPVPGGYQLFVHIDGPGQRLNGDHEPVDGHYPTRLWETGDIVVDRQELRVPANYPRGNLTIFMGFYSGEQRLEILSGPEDDVNRARVGILPVR